MCFGHTSIKGQEKFLSGHWGQCKIYTKPKFRPCFVLEYAIMIYSHVTHLDTFQYEITNNNNWLYVKSNNWGSHVPDMVLNDVHVHMYQNHKTSQKTHMNCPKRRWNEIQVIDEWLDSKLHVMVTGRSWCLWNTDLQVHMQEHMCA